MNDFLDLVLARSYAQVPTLVQPYPIARFELPELLAPEAAPEAVPPAPGTPASSPVAVFQPVSIAMPAAAPVVTHELLRTRELLTIREIQPVSAAPRPEPDISVSRPAQPDPGIAHVRKPVMPDFQADVQPAIHTEAQAAAMLTPQQAALPIALVLPMLPRAGQDELPLTRRSDMPTVHVRIGRIEVQSPAVPATPVRSPAVRSAPAPVRPVRSLDDYLRSRNEGR